MQSISRLPAIYWDRLGRVALSPGEHRCLTDAEIKEINDILERPLFSLCPHCHMTGGGNFGRCGCWTRMEALFRAARERYLEDAMSFGNAGNRAEENEEDA